MSISLLFIASEAYLTLKVLIYFHQTCRLYSKYIKSQTHILVLHGFFGANSECKFRDNIRIIHNIFENHILKVT